MKGFFGRSYRNPENRTVIRNAFSLYGLQIANTLLPLVTVPYIVRVIGPGKYGLISFAQAFVTYFVLIVNYGFDLSASREIARVRQDDEHVAKIFWSVVWAKVVLFLMSCGVFASLLLSIGQVRADSEVMIVSFLVLIGFIAFPTWLFQGMEKLGLTAIFNFILKTFFTIGIFIFVRQRGDYMWVPLLSSLGQITAGVLAFVYATRKFVKGLRTPKLEDVRFELKSGWTIFLSVVFISFYTTSNVVILGFFATQESVGYFAAATKIIVAFEAMLMYPIGQAVYPHLGKLMVQNRERGVDYLRKMAFFVAIISIPMCIGVFVLSPIIVGVFLGSEFLPSIQIMKILCPFPLVIGLNNVFGIQGVLNLREDRRFLVVIVSAAVLDLVANLLMAGRLHEIGTAIAWLITELYVMISLLLILEKNGVGVLKLKFYRRWLRSQWGGNKG